jgi:hypothetical protein
MVIFHKDKPDWETFGLILQKKKKKKKKKRVGKMYFICIFFIKNSCKAETCLIKTACSDEALTNVLQVTQCETFLWLMIILHFPLT